MIDVVMFFFLVGGIFFAGFLGLKFFERTKISDLLVLLLIGLLIGPVLHLLSEAELALLKGTMPLFAALALIILLFEGGMQLNFFRVIKSLKFSTIFTISVFAANLVFTSALLLAMGWSLLEGLMVGAILGGTCSAVVLPLIQRTAAKEETKTLLSLEASLTDALCVIIAISFIELIQARIIVGNVFSSIAAAFSIACVLGFAAGIIWLKYAKKADQRFLDLLTIASLFLVYAMAEYLKGNGAIAALVFGIVLGNSKEITSMLRIGEIDFSSRVKFYGHELAFFVRAFFFVYIGIILELKFLSGETLFAAMAITALFIVARTAGSRLLVFLNKGFLQDGILIKTMMGRGLAAAVLSLMPLTMNAVPFEKGMAILQITFLVIIFSNIITTCGVFYAENMDKEKKGKKEDDAQIEKIEIK